MEKSTIYNNIDLVDLEKLVNELDARWLSGDVCDASEAEVVRILRLLLEHLSHKQDVDLRYHKIELEIHDLKECIVQLAKENTLLKADLIRKENK